MVVDDELYENGDELIRYLASITAEEIARKRRNMRALAPIMQWGWGANSGDALHMTFAALMNDRWTYAPTPAPSPTRDLPKTNEEKEIKGRNIVKNGNSIRSNRDRVSSTADTSPTA